MRIIITVKDTDNIVGLKEDIAMRLEGVADIVRIDTADVVPKSEVERLQAELDDKQFRCDSCDRIMLTGAEHRACVNQAKAEVAREIFEEIETIVDNNTYKSYLPNSSLWSKEYKIKQIITELAELKKKYTGDEE